MDKLSIIIRNRNEERWIGHAIQSCLDHFNDPEIIIVDNNSTDDSMEIVNSFCFSNIKVIKIDHYTPGKALNLAVKECTYNTILVLSAHCQITNIDLDYVKDQLKEDVAVFGKQIPIYRGKKITPRYIWSNFIDQPYTCLWSELENRRFLHNGFCFYNKAILEKFPFNEALAGKEDRYWAEDIYNKGFTYLYTPEFTCNHHWTLNGNTWKGIG